MKKGRLGSCFGKFVTTHPWWVLLLTVIAVSGMAAGLHKLGLKTDYRVYFGEENPQLLAFNEMQDIYNKSDSVLFVLEPEDGTVFTSQTLKAIVELTEKSWKIPYSSRVDSITNFQHTRVAGDELIVEDLVQNIEQATDDDLVGVKNIALSEPLLVNNLRS